MPAPALTLNAAKAARHQLERDLFALENRAALLRDAEEAALRRAAAMASKAESATLSHGSRAYSSLLWSAAKESGAHPLAGLPYAPTPGEAAAAAQFAASLSQLPGGDGALAALAATRAEQAAAAGAELALRSPSSAPPLHPIALAAWVATRREVLAEAVAGQAAALTARRTQEGSEEREVAAQRRQVRLAARAARLQRDRLTVDRLREEDAAARGDREARAAAARQAARAEYEGSIAAELEQLRLLAERIAPLRAAEEELTQRAALAAQRQGSAHAALAASVTFPPLPLRKDLPPEALALATAAASSLNPTLAAHALTSTLGSRRGGLEASRAEVLGSSSSSSRSPSSARGGLSTTGAGLVRTSPRVAEATVGVRSAIPSALFAASPGGSAILASTASSSSSSMSVPYGSSGSGSGSAPASSPLALAASASFGGTGRSSSSSNDSPRSFGWAVEPPSSSPQRGGGSATASSSSSSSSSSRGSAGRGGVPAGSPTPSKLLLPVGLWHTVPLPLTQSPLSVSLRLPSLEGGEGAQPRVVLPPPGSRSPQVSTLRATTVTQQAAASARALVSAGYRGAGGVGEEGGGSPLQGSAVFSMLESSFAARR